MNKNFGFFILTIVLCNISCSINCLSQEFIEAHKGTAYIKVINNTHQKLIINRPSWLIELDKSNEHDFMLLPKKGLFSEEITLNFECSGNCKYAILDQKPSPFASIRQNRNFLVITSERATSNGYFWPIEKGDRFIVEINALPNLGLNNLDIYEKPCAPCPWQLRERTINIVVKKTASSKRSLSRSLLKRITIHGVKFDSA